VRNDEIGQEAARGNGAMARALDEAVAAGAAGEVPVGAVVVRAGRVQAGDMELLGQKDDGTHVHAHVVDRTGSGRVLVLDTRAGLGQVEVVRG